MSKQQQKDEKPIGARHSIVLWRVIVLTLCAVIMLYFGYALIVGSHLHDRSPAMAYSAYIALVVIIACVGFFWGQYFKSQK